MKNKILFLFTIIILSSKIALPCDFWKLNFIGFSEDGNYLAFERYTTQDGSGFPVSEIIIVDVIKNEYVNKPFHVFINIDPEGNIESDKLLKQCRDKCYNLAKSDLMKYKIVEKNTGTLVYSAYENDYEGENPVSLSNKNLQFDYNNSQYTLILKEIAAQCQNEFAYKEEQYKMFELILKSRFDKKTIQSDTKIPKSRNCPLEYGIYKVFTYKSYIAVFLDYKSRPSFETPNIEKMVVTGKFFESNLFEKHLNIFDLLLNLIGFIIH